MISVSLGKTDYLIVILMRYEQSSRIIGRGTSPALCHNEGRLESDVVSKYPCT